jgi:phenylacetate-CoA ligase
MRIIKEDPSPRVTTLKLRVEYGAGISETQLDELEQEIRTVMKSELRVNPQIEWAEPESLQTASHKQPMFEKRY